MALAFAVAYCGDGKNEQNPDNKNTVKDENDDIGEDKADFTYDGNYLAKIESTYIEGEESSETENFRFDR